MHIITNSETMGQASSQPCILDVIEFGDRAPVQDLKVHPTVQNDIEQIEDMVSLQKTIFRQTMSMDTRLFKRELDGYVIQLETIGSLHIIPPRLMHLSVLRNKKLCNSMKLDNVKKQVLKVIICMMKNS